MAFAEQQRWITVQQKTFTKWLNTKLEARNLEVKDVVKDLSDGVSGHREREGGWAMDSNRLGTNSVVRRPGAAYPPVRMPLKRISRKIRREAQVASATF
jgi:hypothetical protein